MKKEDARCELGSNHEQHQHHHATSVSGGVVEAGCDCSSSAGRERQQHSAPSTSGTVMDVGCGCCGETEEKKEKEESSGLKLTVSLLIASVALVLVATFAPLPFAASVVLYLVAYVAAGYDVVWRAIRNIGRGTVFDEYFLMSIATIGALIIGEFAEAIAVMVFYKVGEIFLDLAVGRSKKSIAALMAIKPERARLLRDNVEVDVAPESVEIGSTIVIRPGERVPLDGVVTEGESFMDTSALTGESVPRAVLAGEEIQAGFVNGGGLLQVTVTRPFGQSALARVLELTANAAENKAPTEKFITRFAKKYTPIVVALAAAIAVVPCFFVGFDQFSQYLYRGLVFLVVSCPCALVVSIPLSYFGGIGGSSKLGVLFKGGTALEALHSTDTLVMDKTGTLTEGVFRVTDVETYGEVQREDLLEMASIAEYNSSHPIARSVLAAHPLTSAPEYESYTEVPGHGIIAVSDGRRIVAGNRKLMAQEGIKVPAADRIGTVIYLAVDQLYWGVIAIGDTLRANAKEALGSLRRAGVNNMIMLTGDNEAIAASISSELQLDGYYGELLPHEKLERLEEIKAGKVSKTAFIGDGINDAPVLAAADVGIAMGGIGSEAAMEAADVVLMEDDLSKLAAAKRLASKTHRIVIQNIALSLIIKVGVLALAAFGLVSMWPAVFADVGVTLIAVINSTRTLRFKQRPDGDKPRPAATA